MRKLTQNIKHDAKVDIHNSSLIEEMSIAIDSELEKVKSEKDDEERSAHNSPEISGREKTMFRSNTFAVYYLSKYWFLFLRVMVQFYECSEWLLL